MQHLGPSGDREVAFQVNYLCGQVRFPGPESDTGFVSLGPCPSQVESCSRDFPIDLLLHAECCHQCPDIEETECFPSAPWVGGPAVPRGFVVTVRTEACPHSGQSGCPRTRSAPLWYSRRSVLLCCLHGRTLPACLDQRVDWDVQGICRDGPSTKGNKAGIWLIRIRLFHLPFQHSRPYSRTGKYHGKRSLMKECGESNQLSWVILGDDVFSFLIWIASQTVLK